MNKRELIDQGIVWVATSEEDIYLIGGKICRDEEITKWLYNLPDANWETEREGNTIIYRMIA